MADIMAKLDIITLNKTGAKFKTVLDLGEATLFINCGSSITVQAFEETKNGDYKRRSKENIIITISEKELFIGTVEQLELKLK